MPKALLGESAFTSDVLNESIIEFAEKERLMSSRIALLESELQNSETTMDEIFETTMLVKNWADCYSDSPTRTKSMIISQFIEKVTVYPGYRLDIHFKLSKSQFLHGESVELEAPATSCRETRNVARYEQDAFFG